MNWEAHLLKQWRQFAAFSLALLLSFSTVVGSDGKRNLTEAEVRELATMALPRFARMFPKLRLDSYGGYPGRPGFYWFDATASVPNNASPVLGHFAVNQTTGDVWDPVACKKLTSPDLTNLQRRMRNRIHLSDQDLRRLSQAAPCEP
jgi:hypothetical protein